MQSRKVSDFSIDSILASKPEPGHRELQTTPNPRHPQPDPPSRGRAPQLPPPPPLRMSFEQFGYQQSNRILTSHGPAPCCLLSWNLATLLPAHSGTYGLGEAGGSAQAQHCQRLRTVFTESQTRQLEALFHTDNYPTVEVRTRLAARIGLSVENVRVWFKNRRARRKRQVQRRAQGGLLTSTSDG